MFFNKKSFLKSEIIKLANEGFINKEQEKAIFGFYHFDENSDFPLLITLAFVFIGLSLLTLVAYNWEQIPNILKTFLLLATLFATHLGIFYSKNSIFQQGFGILSGFVLLANIALLSQIYHLGEDTALAFLSVGCVVLFLALILKSFSVFITGYLLTSVWYFLSFDDHSIHLFICLILLGIIVQSGILFCLSLNAARFLAFLNFVFLNLYLYNFQGNNLNLSTFAWLSLIILGFHLKSYQSYAFFALALTFIALSYDANHLFLSISSISLSALLILLGAINLYFKHYFLGILTISLLLIGNYSNLYPTNAIILKGFYSFFTFLLGIHFIKENHKILGLLTFSLLIVIRYLDLLGDYIGASVVFLCFGLGLLLFARRKNA
ncbi:DUF2157 domain-containing protein [uncultured Helicobacter sp.]|uniref:DUF2157 domain-containing protein n=1 Tax=uncultured Helicobacter sp. TaxID=175537 RepID=UPI002619F63F|nr:DUF2157 domain-containing protein [uncultured Helicobacter sp.]